MAINTSKTIERASTVLKAKCEETTKNMTRLMRRAGCEGDVETMSIDLPAGNSPKDDVLYIGLNGVDFYFMRGTVVDMPLPLVEIAANCGIIPKRYGKTAAEKMAAGVKPAEEAAPKKKTAKKPTQDAADQTGEKTEE